MNPLHPNGWKTKLNSGAKIEQSILQSWTSIEVIDKKSQRSTGEIPELLKDALSVSFDVSIGHDQIEDKDARLEFYNTEEEKLPLI